MQFAVLLMLIEGVITFTLMKRIMDGILDMKNPRMKWKAIGFLGHPMVSFSVNLAISVLLTQFTGGGLNAGFANLGSSVIVAFLVPMYVRAKTAGTSEKEELERMERKRAYEERKKRREETESQTRGVNNQGIRRFY